MLLIITVLLIAILRAKLHDSTCYWHCNFQFGSWFSGEYHIPNKSAGEHLPYVLSITSALSPIFVKHKVLSDMLQEQFCKPLKHHISQQQLNRKERCFVSTNSSYGYNQQLQRKWLYFSQLQSTYKGLSTFFFFFFFFFWPKYLVLEKKNKIRYSSDTNLNCQNKFLFCIN